MRRFFIGGSFVISLAVAAAAQAGLIDQFNGFTFVDEIGLSGLKSSYHADTVTNLSVLGPTTGNALHVLGSNRVHYPNQGEVPSGGSAYDYGALGIRVDNGNLIVRVANGFNPLTGRHTNDTTYGAGDAFLTISDSNGVRQFAALNTWARDSNGTPRSIGDGHFNDARDFHVSGGSGGTSLEGHLILLDSNNDVRRTGGPHGYGASNAPDGLDLRVFARGGVDLGALDLVHTSLVDGQNWYLQTWTIPLAMLSSDPFFSVGVHVTQSCGNDQIGIVGRVPEPASLMLVGGGALLALARRRNY
jgi:hypothetical protein